MKRFLHVSVLALALLGYASGAGAQDKAQKNYTVVVGHVVTLGWTAVAITNPTYNVYVSGTSGGPYTKIGNTAQTQFADKNGTAGNTYFYVVTTVDSTGAESLFSVEVSAKIPTP